MKSQTLSQDEFLKVLVPKLEAIKRDQDQREMLNQKLQEVSRSSSTLHSNLINYFPTNPG